MQVYLQGGFGEKGRTSVCLQADGTTVMLDAGIKVGAPEDTYHPQLAVPAKILDAVVITHAHEDHVGALCWLAGQGFSGPIYMTAETLSETPTTLTQYARPADLAAHPLAAMDIRIVRIETPFSIGSLTINTGHSGHVSGGMWIAATTKSSSVLYCGDVVPNSAVFPMTPLPAANLMLLDAAYGADSVTARQRAVSIAAWIAAQPTGCLLPTPLSGRSLELIAIQQNQFAIEAGMTKPLMAQIEAISGYNPAMAEHLATRVRTANLWREGAEFPAMPLLVHDGMGSAGPAATAILQALANQTPMLFTGHLPDGSPAAIAYERGKADWIRLPTHPTLDENILLWKSLGKPRVFGHSCSTNDMADLGKHIHNLNTTVRTGQTHTLEGNTANANFDR